MTNIRTLAVELEGEVQDVLVERESLMVENRNLRAEVERLREMIRPLDEVGVATSKALEVALAVRAYFKEEPKP
tara:strand:- start:9755 stop:9976 length:222 start_codon:yes stop_codon:yes gene_type:complete